MVDTDLFQEVLREEDPYLATTNKSKNWTVDQWRKHLIHHHKTNDFRVLPKSVLFSEPYFRLSYPARDLLVIAFAELNWAENLNRSGRRRSKRQSGKYQNAGIGNQKFCLPYAMIRARNIGPKARGLCGPSSIHRAIEELIEVGFLDRVTKSEKGVLQVYKMSNRYNKV
jgi:hypothetical protein